MAQGGSALQSPNLPKKLTTLTRKQSEQNENEQEQTKQEEGTKLGI